MWVFHSLRENEKPVVVYHSSLSRARPVIEEVLTGFTGYLHCDDYSAYQNIPRITTVAC